MSSLLHQLFVATLHFNLLSISSSKEAVQIRTFTEVTFIVRESGEFTRSSSWLGGKPPANETCSPIGGCDLYVSNGFNLSTVALNGQLSINLKEIIIAVGGVFELGSVGHLIPFKFLYKVIISCFGHLVDISGGDRGIYLPFGSNLIFYASGYFTSQVSTFLYAYDATSGMISGTSVSLTISLTGPYEIDISVSGEISISTNGKINFAC